MIINGLTITVIGMGIVFGFLILLVLAMIFLNFALRKFFPKSLETKPEARKAADSTSGSAKKDDLAVIAAAVAAIKAHVAVTRG